MFTPATPYSPGPGAKLSYADAQLSQKFGPEVTNYFSGSPLNRVAFLRGNQSFLQQALLAASFVLLNPSLDPLSTSRTTLAHLPYSDLKTTIGTPYALSESQQLATHDSSLPPPPPLVFLGIDEADKTSGFSFSETPETRYTGHPYFAIEVPSWPIHQFREPRKELDLPSEQAAILAQARSIIDWNRRNGFCAGCGSRTVSVHAGMKRMCPALDAEVQTRPCIARVGVHNIAFPRTDPTVIMAIISADGERLLLGRSKRWPAGFVSCLAGFCEPAESVEDAVRRESYEEAGVRVGRVVVHSSQPWPYPNSLMLGCVAQALQGGEEINLGHDPELEDARWYGVEEVRGMLGRRWGGEGGARGLPPSTAIAHQLLLSVVNNFHGGLKI